MKEARSFFGIRLQGRYRSRECIADRALSRADERLAFERFVDLVTARLGIHPDLHIYHAPTTSRALKRLMDRVRHARR